MSVDFRSAGHSGAESHHYYRQDTAPTIADPLQVGDLWSDTAANLLKRCTSVAPVTFVSVEGGSAAHDLFSITHGDVDELDTPADDDVLTYDNAGGSWRAEAASGHGSHPANHADLGGIGADDHHNRDHAAAHSDGGSDEVTVQNLGSATAADGQVLKADGAGGLGFEDDSVVVNFIIDGGGSAIATGEKGHVEPSFAMTITGWTILADQSGSIVVDVWKNTYANYPPTSADSIAGTEKPTLSSAQKSQDLSLTTWTTAVAAGDILAFNVDSASTVTRVTVALRGRKT
jgi:hypothetical protein